MDKRNFKEKGMTQIMERINRGQMGEDRKREVEGRCKGVDRSGRGKREIKQEIEIV